MMLGSMAFLREHGYAFGVRNLHASNLRDSPEHVFSKERNEYPVMLASEIQADQNYPLASVLAPVFDAQHEVVFVLGLMGFDTPITGARIENMGKRLREACNRITTFIAGKPPA
jgi:hypothetical protein